MPAIRVLIGDMPTMLQSMVTAMLDEEEGIILIDPRTECDPETAIGDVDVILVAADRMAHGFAGTTGDRMSLPNGIVAIADDASEATIIHLSSSHWPLADSRKDSIGGAIRRAARPGNLN